MSGPEILARVERACTELLADGAAVTFAAVAARAGLSRATLYRDEDLHAVVEEHRQTSRDPGSLSSVLAEVRHLRTAVEALAGRVRDHEEQLRRLRRSRKAN